VFFTLGTFLAGALAVVLALWLARVLRSRGLERKWHLWLAAGAWYLWTVLGISFVFINMAGRHAQAASVGALLFFGVSVFVGVLLARICGLLGTDVGRRQRKAAA